MQPLPNFRFSSPTLPIFHSYCLPPTVPFLGLNLPGNLTPCPFKLLRHFLILPFSDHIQSPPLFPSCPPPTFCLCPGVPFADSCSSVSFPGFYVPVFDLCDSTPCVFSSTGPCPHQLGDIFYLPSPTLSPAEIAAIITGTSPSGFIPRP